MRETLYEETGNLKRFRSHQPINLDNLKFEMGTYTQETTVRKYRFIGGDSRSVVPIAQRLYTGKNHYGDQVDVPRRLITPKELLALRLDGASGDKKSARESITTSLVAFYDEIHHALAFAHDPDLLGVISRNPDFIGDRQAVHQRYAGEDTFKINLRQIDRYSDDNYADPQLRRSFLAFAAEGDGALVDRYIDALSAETDLPFKKLFPLSFYRHSVVSDNPQCALRFFNFGYFGTEHGEYKNIAINWLDRDPTFVGVAPDDAQPVIPNLNEKPDLEHVLEVIGADIAPSVLDSVREKLERLYSGE